MALGAVTTALSRARITGQAVPVTVNGVTMMAYPNGNVGGYGVRSAGNALSAPVTAQPVLPSSPASNVAGVAGAVGSPSGPAPSTGPFGAVSANIPTMTVTANAQPQPVMNQANPLTTYVSPNTPQPATAVPVTGQAGTQSGPSLADQAKNYRVHHGLATSDDAATEALNTQSLAAAQAGRTSFDPTAAAQYGQPQAAGTYGPPTTVVNALSAPATTATTQTALSPATVNWPTTRYNQYQQGTS